MEGIIITAIICGTVIMISLIDKIGKNKCKNCKRCISKAALNEIAKSTNDTLNDIAIGIEALLR